MSIEIDIKIPTCTHCGREKETVSYIRLDDEQSDILTKVGMLCAPNEYKLDEGMGLVRKAIRKLLNDPEKYVPTDKSRRVMEYGYRNWHAYGALIDQLTRLEGKAQGLNGTLEVVLHEKRQR